MRRALALLLLLGCTHPQVEPRRPNIGGSGSNTPDPRELSPEDKAVLEEAKRMKAAEEEAARRAQAEQDRKKAEAEEARKSPEQMLAENPPGAGKEAPQPAPKPLPKPKPRPKPPGPGSEPPRPGFDQMHHPKEAPYLIVGVPVNIPVYIGDPQAVAKVGDGVVQNIPVSTSYLVGLECDPPDSFKIEPDPGQQKKQKRAPRGSTAYWHYWVTPLKKGEHKLIYTLRAFQAEDDDGTVIKVEPVHTVARWGWPATPKFLISKLFKEWGLGATVLGMVGAAVGAWWKARRERATS